MTTPVIITAQGGSVSATPVTGGTWPATFDPPTHPHATIDVPCVKPGVGMFAHLPENDTDWLCVGETVVLERTEGLASANIGFWDRVDSHVITTKGRWLSPLLSLHFPTNFTSGAYVVPSGINYGDEVCWWWDHGTLHWLGYEYLTHWGYYHNSVATFDPCEQLSWEEETAKWAQMYENWHKRAGLPSWAEQYTHYCYWVRLERWQPPQSFLIPMYAGGMMALSGLLGGGGGAFGAAAFLPFVLAALQAAFSASAAAAGRILKDAEQEDILDFL